MAKNSERNTLGVLAGQQVIVSQLEQMQARVPANLPQITMRIRSVPPEQRGKIILFPAQEKKPA